MREYNLLVNDDKLDGIDSSDGLLEHIENLLYEVNEAKMPAIFNVDFIKSDALHISKKNRAISLEMPLLPVGGSLDKIDNSYASAEFWENANKDYSKDEIDTLIKTQAREIYDHIVNELALAYAEAKSNHDKKTYDFIENLNVMDDYNIKDCIIKYDKLDSILNTQNFSNSAVESAKKIAIEKYLKKIIDSFNNKTLHVVCYNGNKYLFGLNDNDKTSYDEDIEKLYNASKHEELDIPIEVLDETKENLIDRERFFKSTDGSKSGMIDIIKGLNLMEYKDALPKATKNLKGMQTQVQFGE